jgi:hypothetical protein
MAQAVEGRQAWRTALLGLVLAAALVVLLVQQARPGGGLAALPLHDFVEYWAAGRLIVRGENPYDPARMEELERAAGRQADGILMWNPPWALALVMPLGLLECRTAHLLWLLLNLAVLLGCADAQWRCHAGPNNLRPLAWLLALLFLPTSFALLAGQISPLLLLGATGFLCAERRRHDFLAGASAALLAIKPHLAYLFWIAILVWCVRRRWKVLLGGRPGGPAQHGHRPGGQPVGAGPVLAHLHQPAAGAVPLADAGDAAAPGPGRRGFSPPVPRPFARPGLAALARAAPAR